MEIAAVILGILAGFVLGGATGILLARRKQVAQQSQVEKEANQRAQRILEQARVEAETVQKNSELKAQGILLEAQKEIEETNRKTKNELARQEARLDKRENALDSRAATLDKKEQDLNQRDAEIIKRLQQTTEQERDIERLHQDAERKLERLAGLTQEQAKSEIVERVTEQARLDAAKTVRQIEEEALSEAERRAKKVLSVAVQRYAGEYVTEHCVSVVNLPNDDMKGRIIGREGRNIRAIEAATGIDLIVDDTPEAVIISGFDPVRREIARLSLERLISDGRIHPSRIEEVVEKTTKEVDKAIREAGEQAAFELGLTNIHPEILRLVGRLKFRTSYGQNQLAHSIEVGFLTGLMAAELGLSVKIARRAGLLHDVGKAMDHDLEGSHAINGAAWLKKYGEKEIVVNAVAAHHDEAKHTSVFSHLVQAADALSGARPGARREVLESYIKRLEDLEKISKSFRGVSECYALQAGREIRVLVENDRVSDDEALILSKDIAHKIEEELVYPGQIKVTVIRETRAVEYAR
ncbi:MAG: ribonuclease Y [Bradymonadales bacterium]|nr:ribonuclease Y [Bradymonadales bacterium]